MQVAHDCGEEDDDEQGLDEYEQSQRVVDAAGENRAEIADVFDGVAKTHVVRHIGPLEPIEEIDASELLDTSSFARDYLRANRPLLIRNALRVYDCGTAFADWSLDYLSAKCGTNKVYVRRKTLADDYKTGKAYMVQAVEFRAYVRDLVANNTQARNSYLAVQNVKKAFPQINDDLRMPPFFEKLHAGPFLWIARAGHYEYTHMDPDDNLLMVIRGRKLVRLYGCDVYAMHPNELGMTKHFPIYIYFFYF